jgi:spermidine synthase
VPDPSKSRLSPPSILAIAFLGGFTFLLYQVSWFRMLSLALGATVSASTVVLAAFMCGLGAGAWSGGQATGRFDPSSLLALVLAGVGATSLVTTFAIRAVLPSVSGPAQLAAALALVFAPAFVMGGLLPAAAGALVADRSELARRLGQLYAWETLGSTLGALTTGFVFIKHLGQQNTLILAAATNLVCAAAILRFRSPLTAPDTGAPAAPPRKTRKAEASPDPALDRRAALLCAAAFGLVVLGLEVAWLRCFHVYLTNASHTFCVITAVVTLGLFAGSRLFSAYGDAHVSPAAVAHLALATALAAVFGLVVMLNLPALVMVPLAGEGDAYAARVLLIPLVSAALIVFPVTVLSGYALPLACTLLGRAGGEVGASTGRVLLFNTLGGVVGPLLAAFVLIPARGAAMTVLIHAVPLFALAAALRRSRALAGAAAVALAIAALAPAPRILPPSFSRFGREVLEYGESVEGTFVVGSEPSRTGSGKVTYVNNSAVIGSTYDAIKVVKMVGHLPFYLGLPGENVLVVGFGIGVTTSAIASHREVKRIDCVELVPGLARVAHHYEGFNAGVYKDPRLNVIAGDGRHHLASTSRVYDLISSDPTHPILGSGSLYTREYFELCHARLSPQGMVSQYLPLHKILERDLRGIIKAFAAAFPGATIWLGHNHAVLLGAKQPLRVEFSNWAARISGSVRDPSFYAEPYHLAACLVLDAEAIAKFPPETPVNTDDRPLTEFFDLASLDARNLVTNLAWLRKERAGVERVFTHVADRAKLDRYVAAHSELIAGLEEQLSGNQRGLFERLAAAARMNPENEEYPFLIRFFRQGPR